MIRLLFYLICASVFAVLVSWLADQQGQTIIHWQGIQIELATSLAIGLLAGVIAIVGVVLWILRRILSWPGLISHNWQQRRRKEGEKALALGMVAFAAGDVKGARRQAKKSQRLLGSGILPELLSAQAAHAAGDMRAAKRYFEALVKVKQTAYFGQIGLMRLHHAEGALEEASDAANKALELEKNSLPALSKILADDLKNRNWKNAYEKTTHLIQLDKAEKSDRAALFRDASQGHLALVPQGQLANLNLLAAHLCLFISEEQDDGYKQVWLKKALAHQAPITEPALRLAQMEGGAGTKTAQKILEKAFITLPHSAYAENLRLYTQHNDGQHIAHLSRLAEKSHHRDMAQLVVAQAAWTAGIWAAASAALADISEQGKNNEYFLLQAHIAQALDDSGHAEDQLTKEQALVNAAHAPHGAGWYCSGCGKAAVKWAEECRECGIVGQIGWQRAVFAESERLEMKKIDTIASS